MAFQNLLVLTFELFEKLWLPQSMLLKKVRRRLFEALLEIKNI
jgi:hypothetical protein